MRVCHFEDVGVSAFEPIGLTRPVFALRLGATTIGQKQRRAFHADDYGALVRPNLVSLLRKTEPRLAVHDSAWLGAGPTLFVNARWLPPLEPMTLPSEPCVACVGNEIAFVYLGADEAGQVPLMRSAAYLESLRWNLPVVAAGGHLLRDVHDLVQQNAAELLRDFAWFAEEIVASPRDGVHVDPSAMVAPDVVFDTTHGPIVVDRQAVIGTSSRLEGPCYVGPRANLEQATIRSGTTLGADVRVMGELAGIFDDDSAKTGEERLSGYIGRAAVIGSAGTRVVFGDYATVHPGTMLAEGVTTGPFAVLNASSQVSPITVPGYCAVDDGRVTGGPDLADLFAEAERRDARFTDSHRLFFRGLYERLAPQRLASLHEAEVRKWRKIA